MGEKIRKTKTRSKQASSRTPKKGTTPYLLKKKKNDKVVAIKVNKQYNTRRARQVWMPKEISTKRTPRKFGSRRGSEKSNGLRGIWRLQNWVAYHGVHHIGSCHCQVG
jgi:hypothetical protein